MCRPRILRSCLSRHEAPVPASILSVTINGGFLPIILGMRTLELSCALTARRPASLRVIAAEVSSNAVALRPGRGTVTR